jgi:hypothetical protein
MGEIFQKYKMIRVLGIGSFDRRIFCSRQIGSYAKNAQPGLRAVSAIKSRQRLRLLAASILGYKGQDLDLPLISLSYQYTRDAIRLVLRELSARGHHCLTGAILLANSVLSA